MNVPLNLERFPTPYKVYRLEKKQRTMLLNVWKGGAKDDIGRVHHDPCLIIPERCKKYLNNKSNHLPLTYIEEMEIKK